MSNAEKVVILTGGVGGAKLVLGVAHVVPPDSITAIVNTGDDFRHLGLPVSPDLDTLLYTLAGKANRAQGWGREGESWAFMDAAKSLGAPRWFALGDGDLALHVLRGEMLAQDMPLSEVTASFAKAWGVRTRMLPMSDDPVGTMIETEDGILSFQEYFVARRCAPIVRSVRFEGAAAARPTPGGLETITDDATQAILIAPSNPFLSIDPILAVPGIAQALRDAKAPVVAVLPIVGGAAVKGPTDKIMRELQLAVTPAAIASHYGDLIDAMLIDARDLSAPPACAYDVADTLMNTLEDRIRVARAALGPDSCRLHARQLPSPDAIVERIGLGLDIDTPEDLRLANMLTHGRWTNHFSQNTRISPARCRPRPAPRPPS